MVRSWLLPHLTCMKMTSPTAPLPLTRFTFVEYLTRKPNQSEIFVIPCSVFILFFWINLHSQDWLILAQCMVHVLCELIVINWSATQAILTIKLYASFWYLYNLFSRNCHGCWYISKDHTKCILQRIFNYVAFADGFPLSKQDLLCTRKATNSSSMVLRPVLLNACPALLLGHKLDPEQVICQ